MSSSQSLGVVGAVGSLWRYPVKSMGGEQLDDAVVTDGGFVGDRAYAVIDQSSGKVASAKVPKKWGDLLHLGATFLEAPRSGAPVPPVRITWPDGAQAIGDHKAETMLSERLGRPVRLTTSRPATVSVERLDPLAAEETIVDIGALMMEGRFADYAAIHIVTTASLARLAELCPEAQFDERRFRPNIVVNVGEGRRGFMENDWVGRHLAIGDEVRLRISDPTPRCSVPTLAQKELTRDTRVLRTIVEHNRLPIALLGGEMLPCIGVYAFVVQGGVVARDHAVLLE
jgi:uncharacterized protein YcbX